MPGYALLAPIPIMHLNGVVDILTKKEYALLGSEAFEIFKKTDVGTKVFIYASHDGAEPEVCYVGLYAGVVGDPLEMRRKEKDGYRPATTVGEKWSFYWKITDLQKLEKPIPLSEIQLATGNYLSSYPRGPIHILN